MNSLGSALTPPTPPFYWKDGHLILNIFIQPRASQTEWAGLHDGKIKIRIAAPPVDNKANQQCLNFLAKSLKTAKSQVKLLQGKTSRSKVFQIEHADADAWNTILNHFLQNS